jgi:hypothetical protein
MSFGDDTLDPSNWEHLKEQQSHDAEIRRIGAKLGMTWPYTVEDIIKEIEKLQKHLDAACLGWA